MNKASLKFRLEACFSTLILLITTAPIISQNLNLEQHVIESNFNGINTIKIIDLDDDGDLDIIGGSSITPTAQSRGLAWWRNEGENSWTRFTIDQSFIDVMSVDIAKIDDDDNFDIVATSWQLNQVAWWKNSGDPTQTWTKKIIRSGFVSAHDAKCADLDNDGDTDVIAASATPGSVLIFYNDGNASVGWQTSTLTNSFSGAKVVYIIDLDKDNNLDILGTAADANEIAWWKNLGGNPITWEKTIIADNFVGSDDLIVDDLNDDSKYDIVATAWKSSEVTYWICNDLSTNTWTKKTIDTELGIAARVRIGNVDNDLDIDIVAIGNNPGELVLYENANFDWTRSVLTDVFERSAGLAIEDLDKDGDQDIIAGASGYLYWWENNSETTSIKINQNEIPDKFGLEQNYPNPFNPSTEIKFSVPEPSQVTLKIFDSTGSVVSTLINERLTAGTYYTNFENVNLSSGVYFYSLTTDSHFDVKKMVLIK